MNDHGAVVFNGDGYSAEWHAEAEQRGLLNLKTTADALPVLKSPEVQELFAKYEVLSERELESRLETYLEQYCLTVHVEANLTLEMARTMIFPAAIRYQSELATTCANLKVVGFEFDTDTLDRVTELIKYLQDGIAALEDVLLQGEDGDLIAQANFIRDTTIPAMNFVRKYADELEGFVADDLWPLPTYQEMLFIR